MEGKKPRRAPDGGLQATPEAMNAYEHRRESATAPARPCELARTVRGAGDQGQVGNRRRHEDLEQSLAATEIACLANAQLDKPSHSMLDHLTLLAEIIELRAVLPLPSRLE